MHRFVIVPRPAHSAKGVLNLHDNSSNAATTACGRESQVDPATLSTVGSLTSLPWTCKPLYGFISDGYPVSLCRTQSMRPRSALRSRVRTLSTE